MTFSRHGDKLFFGNGFPPSGFRFRAHYIGYFSKSACEPTKYQYCSFAPKIEIPARDHSVFVTCWAFFCSSLEQVLGRTYTHTHGKRPAFLCLDVASCAENINSPHPRSLWSPPFLQTVFIPLQLEIRLSGKCFSSGCRQSNHSHF